jgi:hypothetical protein
MAVERDQGCVRAHRNLAWLARAMIAKFHCDFVRSLQQAVLCSHHWHKHFGSATKLPMNVGIVMTGVSTMCAAAAHRRDPCALESG